MEGCHEEVRQEQETVVRESRRRHPESLSKTLKPKEPTGSELRNVVGGLKRNPLG